MKLCKYCGGEYKNQGGVTQHLRKCPEREKDIRLEEAKYNQSVVITNNYFITIEKERPIFLSFSNELMRVLSSGWFHNACNGGYNNSRNALRMIRDDIYKSNQDNVQIGTWLSGTEIIREITDENVDGQKLIEHTVDNVNEIENKALSIIKNRLSPKDFEQLKKDVDSNGLLGV